MPQSVSYARALLYLQASIWGLLCVAAIVNATSSSPWSGPALTIGAAGTCGALAGAKTWLGHRISRGSDRTRHGVIVVETLMACLGALLTLISVIPGGAILAMPSLVGGGLSLAAVIVLMQPPARQYFTMPARKAAKANPASRPDERGSVPFWRASRTAIA